MEFYNLTALELAAALKKGEVSVAQAVQAARARMEARREDNAFLTPLSPAPESIDLDASPLAGVPMAYKDNICTRGVPTTCASRMLEGFVPPYDAAAAEHLTAAGAVCMGKLNMDEFAMGSTSETSYWGPVRNPWDPQRSAGGSSGGAAAAVAGGQVWYAIGSDTGGSIRQPAAHCGVTGMKPTYGAVSRYGLVAYASSLDQIGPIARSAADCAAVLDILRGKDRRDSTSVELPGGPLLDALTGRVKGLSIALPEQYLEDGPEGGVAAAVREAADTFRALGARVETVSLPALDWAVSAYYILACAQASSNLARFDGVTCGRRAPEGRDLAQLCAASRTQGFGREVKRRLLLGTFVLSHGYYDAYYKKALQAAALIKDGLNQTLEEYDLILSPVAPTAAPRLGESLSSPLEMYLSDLYTVPANLAGLPAVAFPCGLDGEGMPVGVQLMGRALEDAAVLNAAHAFQLATPWHKMHPEGGKRP